MIHAYMDMGIIYSLIALDVAETSRPHSATPIRMADGFIIESHAAKVY